MDDATLFATWRLMRGDREVMAIPRVAFLRSIMAGSPLPCESTRSDPRAAELRNSYFAPLGITAVLDVPLVREGRTVGVLFHEHTGSPRPWSADDRTFMSTSNRSSGPFNFTSNAGCSRTPASAGTSRAISGIDSLSELI